MNTHLLRRLTAQIAVLIVCLGCGSGAATFTRPLPKKGMKFSEVQAIDPSLFTIERNLYDLSKIEKFAQLQDVAGKTYFYCLNPRLGNRVLCLENKKGMVATVEERPYEKGYGLDSWTSQTQYRGEPVLQVLTALFKAGETIYYSETRTDSNTVPIETLASYSTKLNGKFGCSEHTSDGLLIQSSIFTVERGLVTSVKTEQSESVLR